MENTYNRFLLYAMPFLAIHNHWANNDKKKKEILAEWERSKNYPRKKKKEVRKRLKLEWAIFSDPVIFDW